MTAATPGQADAYARVVEQLAKVRAIVFRSDTQQSRIRDLVELLDPALAAQEPHAAPELDLASDEMRPGELDTTLATVPPCEAISSWGMRCRVIRAHEVHRDRDGNMWHPERELQAQPAPGLAALREQVRLARQDRDQLRTAVLSLAAELENEAAGTYSAALRLRDDPAGLVLEEQAEAKRSTAIRLRAIAEPPA